MKNIVLEFTFPEENFNVLQDIGITLNYIQTVHFNIQNHFTATEEVLWLRCTILNTNAIRDIAVKIKNTNSGGKRRENRFY